MGYNAPMIYVVDKDRDTIHQLRNLCRSVGHQVAIFDHPEQFLDDADLQAPGCVVTDIRLPGMSSFELHRELQRRGSILPIIYVSQYGDIPTIVRLLKQGAADFIQKPFRDQVVLEAIQEALTRSSHESTRLRHHRNLRRLVNMLTEREREILDLIVEGLPNKQIAGELHISEKTVEYHRSNIMRKMEADSLAKLVRKFILYRGLDGTHSSGYTPIELGI